MAKNPIPKPTANSVERTPEEEKFLNEPEINGSNESKKSKAKGRQISMTDEYFEEINQFLVDFPNEGTRSSLVVRAVDLYMRKVRTERKSV